MTVTTRTISAAIPAPFGSLVLRIDETGLCAVDIRPEEAPAAGDATEPLIAETARQFGLYFADPRFEFSIPLVLGGTRNQQAVWDALRRIPAGSTRTYGELAQDLGSSARGIAAACRSNPLPIVIPCHRVVGRSSLGGYCGDTSGRWFAVKLWLLRHEGSLAAF